LSALVREMQKISQRFDATQSLDGVSIALHKGEVHAPVGGTSAGKSTLIKIIVGIDPPDRRPRWEIVA
jgi:ABC-type sugar transport system ATPase subunit